MSVDGSRIVSGSGDNTIREWDVESGRDVAKLDGHTEPVTGFLMSADGGRIVSGSRSSTIRVWGVVESWPSSCCDERGWKPNCECVSREDDPREWEDVVGRVGVDCDGSGWGKSGAVGDRR